MGKTFILKLRQAIGGVTVILVMSGCASFGNWSNNEQTTQFNSDKVIHINENDPRAVADYHFAVGEALSLEGKSAEAIEHFKLTLNYDDKSVTVYQRLASEYLKTGRLSAAIDACNSALEIDPESVETHLLLGALYVTGKLYNKALEQYEKVIKIQPDHTEAAVFIGSIYAEQRQFGRAVTYFQQLIKNPKYKHKYLAHYYIGRTYLEDHSVASSQKALDAFRSSLKEKPDYVDAVIALSQTYESLKNKTKSVSVLVQFQSKNGYHQKTASRLADLYIHDEELDLAYEQLTFLEEFPEDLVTTRMRMALILIDRKILDKAAEKLEQILADVPDSDKIRFYLGAVYEEMKKPTESVFHFTKVPAFSQYYAESVVHSVNQLRSQGRNSEAEVLALQAVKVRKDQPQLWLTAASILDETGKFNQAESYLKEASEQFQNNPMILFFLGAMYEKTGKRDLIVDTMKRVLEIDPKHAQALNYVAYIWAEDGVNLPEAESYARRAHNLAPGDAYILDTLGWICYKLGRLPESVRLLEQAYRMRSDVSIIAEHLGDAYYGSTMVEKAKSMYAVAVKLETDKTRVIQLAEKMNSLEFQNSNEFAVPQARPQLRLPASEK